MRLRRDDELAAWLRSSHPPLEPLPDTEEARVVAADLAVKHPGFLIAGFRSGSLLDLDREKHLFAEAPELGGWVALRFPEGRGSRDRRRGGGGGEPKGLLSTLDFSPCRCYDGSIGCLGPPCVDVDPDAEGGAS